RHTCSTLFPYTTLFRSMKALDNERAVRIFKIGMGDVFNLKKIGPKIYESLFYFGKDCDAFIEKLTDEKDFYYNAFVDYAKQKLKDRKSTRLNSSHVKNS